MTMRISSSYLRTMTEQVKKTNQMRDLIVVGGGASGLMAGIAAARSGIAVTILDHQTEAGRKLLSTGNGKCNFTNRKQGSEYYRCSDPAFVLQVIEAFSERDTIRFFEELGILSCEKNGYYYPRNGQASAIREALLAETDRLGIELRTDIGIRSIRRTESGFYFDTKSGAMTSQSCILAAGGKAAPKTGSDGSGFIYAGKLGHSVRTPLPALVPLVCDAKWLPLTAGVRAAAKVSLFIDGEKAASDTGEVQLTDYGISGIPVFQVSRFASEALSAERAVTAQLDFLPELDEEEIAAWLEGQAKLYGDGKNLEELLSGLVHKKIAAMICEKKDRRYQASSVRKIVRRLKQLRLPVIATRSFEQAQTTCGGIPLEELKPVTLESRLVPGLFFAGEMLDVDGMCGGYNLQWAWSSGVAAARGVGEYLGRSNMRKDFS